MFLVSTTQRCGSTWVTRLLNQAVKRTLDQGGAPHLAEKCRPRYVDGIQLGFRLRRVSSTGAPAALAQQLAELTAHHASGSSVVFKTHDIPSKDFDRVCAAIPDLQLVTVRRDFKDVVVSRYFYYRYYWPADPTLGPLCPSLAQALAKVASLNDRAALHELLKGRLFLGWAREWQAFETPFHTRRALRVTYDGLSDGADLARLQEFVGCSLPKLDPFAVEQRMETQVSGRMGRERFNRQGTAGQWRNWFTPEEGERLDAVCKSAALAQPARELAAA